MHMLLMRAWLWNVPAENDTIQDLGLPIYKIALEKSRREELISACVVCRLGDS